jgi:hypothetical protein
MAITVLINVERINYLDPGLPCLPEACGMGKKKSILNI